jgi:hypothetical protein
MRMLEDIRKQTLDRINRIRRVKRILDKPEFEQAWLSVTLIESQEIEAMIALNQASKLETWLNAKCSRTYDEMTLKELRDLARVHSIPYYAAMNKSTLIWEICNAIARPGNASLV